MTASPRWQLAEFFQGVFEAPTYHLMLEAGLFLWVCWLLFRKSYKPKIDVLTEKVSSLRSLHLAECRRSSSLERFLIPFF